MNTTVDSYFNKQERWQEELQALRTIILDCNLTEELKWAIPVYTFHGKNIVGINGLKESVALSFFKGALLQDANGILTKPGEHTQAGRWIKFTSTKEIVKLEPILKAYIFEAIEVEKAGLKVIKKQTSDFKVPEEFQQKLDEMPALKKAFNGLTPGRQGGYLFYFSQAKQSKTRMARIEKYIDQILHGKGITD